MEIISVYNYRDPRQFLLDHLASRQGLDENFSVRKWAKEMELKSHSLLVLLLQGKRNIRIQHCDFIKKAVALEHNEFTYLKTLVKFTNAKTIEEKKLMEDFLHDLHPGDGFTSKEVAEFIVISDWVYMAIMAMTDLKDFKGTEEEILERLGNRATPHEVRSAMIRLMDLKLVTWSDDGKLTPTFRRISTRDDISNEGAKKYHEQVIDLAKKAVREQDLDQREFQSFTMAVAKEKIPLAKEMIRNFRAKLSKAVSGDGDNVYQTNIQFFQLTDDQDVKSKSSGVAKDLTTNEENSYVQ